MILIINNCSLQDLEAFACEDIDWTNKTWHNSRWFFWKKYENRSENMKNTKKWTYWQFLAEFHWKNKGDDWFDCCFKNLAVDV